jgi:type IV secretory pathway VirB10-like protein
MDNYYYDYNDDDYDGGMYFANSKELFDKEGIKNVISVKDRIAQLERTKREGDNDNLAIPIPPPQPPQRVPSPPPPSQQRISPPPQSPPPQLLQPPQQAPQPQRVQQPQLQVPQHTTYVVRDYRDDPVYVRLYDWGIGYIPTYYPYLRRKQLEDSIAYVLNREMLTHRSTYELKKMILSLLDSEIKKDTSPYIQDTSVTKKLAKKKVSKKATTKKPSKKKSSKKSSKKKTSKKTTKKKSKKSSKKK